MVPAIDGRLQAKSAGAAMASPISPSSTPPPGSFDQYVQSCRGLEGWHRLTSFSQFYIGLYLLMALLSLTTVVLSATSDCPTLAFYILEIIVNTSMIAEVVIRLIAFGKQFWQSYWNALDLVITCFCAITLVVIFFSGCSAKGEEVFDTFLLVVRNLFQFGRLALVLRKSGKSVFARPAPIDLSAARAYSLDLDLDDEEALSTERRAMGGDIEAQRKQARRTGDDQRQFLLDTDEED
uniref:FGENESH: predicted gene_5.371 protein n=1 Tax=Rhodotorula toruloides TaxID=5286 RepID=A0A0K3CEJ1_RHOTO